MSGPGQVDELFGGAGQPRPRTGLAYGLLGGGVLASVAGLACTVVPGAVVVLLAWNVAETELAKVESGYLPVAEEPGLKRLQRATHLGVAAVILLLTLQVILFCSGVYTQAFGWLLEQIAALGEPPPI